MKSIALIFFAHWLELLPQLLGLRALILPLVKGIALFNFPALKSSEY